MNLELKPLPGGDLAEALALAERCRTSGEPEEAESVCLDVLDANPQDERALVLLLLVRTDLLERGLPGAVDRARELLPRMASEFDRAYYGGVICERQAKYLLRQRGKRTGFVAYDWFRYAMEEYEAAMALEPERQEPVLRWNACARTLMRNPHCTPDPDERLEHEIE
jgi:hypothetical protein